MDFEKLKWKQHSHISCDNSNLNTEVATVNGKKFYRHSITRKKDNGYRFGKSKVTYSETLDSADVTEQTVIKLMELAYQKCVG